MIPVSTTLRSQDELKYKPKEKKKYLLQRDEIIAHIRFCEGFSTTVFLALFGCKKSFYCLKYINIPSNKSYFFAQKFAKNHIF
ncbi:hypothetical protein NOVO_00035 [Rickettsiales bacterium Ac37b]|nr:hypothetical protein NOVO_00035 [Rickettsiales bacterium Ac37b]